MNIIKKSLRFILACAMVLSCLGLLPTAVKPANAATALTVSTHKGGSKNYAVTLKQTKVNERKADITFKKIKNLKKKKFKKVVVTTYMIYGKTKLKKSSKTMTVKKISSKTKKFTISVPAFGRYRVEVKFYNKKKKVAKKVTVNNVGIVAKEYNIVAFNGTFPNLIFSTSWWEISKDADGKTIPTMVTFTRPDAYNWKKLPAGIISNPYTAKPVSTGFSALAKYTADLYNANKNSKFHLYMTDNNIQGLLSFVGAARFKDSAYDVTLISDGAGTYEWFNKSYNGTKSAESVHSTMTAEWSIAYKQWQKGNKIDTSSFKYTTPEQGKALSLSKYTYAAVSENSNIKWWVANKAGFSCNDADFLNEAKDKIIQTDLPTLLTNIKAEKHEKELKEWLHLDEDMFKDAIKNKRKVMILMGTRVQNEKYFEEFAKFVKKYYGNKYEYYYKGHPGTPTKLYPEKQAQLSKLKMHDIESSIAAELILFYFPDCYVSGLSKSTLNQSYVDGHTMCYQNLRKAPALADPDNDRYKLDKFESYFTKITSDYETEITDLVKDSDPEYAHSFLVEFNDTSEHDIAIYDSEADSITYYKLNSETNAYDKI